MSTAISSPGFNYDYWTEQKHSNLYNLPITVVNEIRSEHAKVIVTVFKLQNNATVLHSLVPVYVLIFILSLFIITDIDWYLPVSEPEWSCLCTVDALPVPTPRSWQ